MHTAKILNVEFLSLLKDLLQTCASHPDKSTNKNLRRRVISPEGNGIIQYNGGQSDGTGQKKHVQMRETFFMPCQRLKGICQPFWRLCRGHSLRPGCGAPWFKCCLRGRFIHFLNIYVSKYV